MDQIPALLTARLRVGVTGATGFLGRHIVAALVARGFTVRAYVRDSSRAVPFGAETHAVGDLLVMRDWSSALEAVDCVVHAAGLAHVSADSSRDVERFTA